MPPHSNSWPLFFSKRKENKTKQNLFITECSWSSVYTATCMCSWGWPLGTRQLTFVFFPWKDHLFSSQISSVACRSLCGFEVSWAFLHPVGHVHWCHPCSADNRHIGETLLACLLISLADTISEKPLILLWLSQPFQPKSTALSEP